MLIDLKTIDSEPKDHEFSLSKDWWISEGKSDPILALDRPLGVKLRIYKAGDSYVMEGLLSGGLNLACNRCLEHFHQDLKSKFRVTLKVPSESIEEGELELGEDELEVDFMRGEEIDLDEIIREQILLTLPIKSLCRENCSGLCPTCGINLNDNRCQCIVEKGHPEFLKLKMLKKRELSD